MKDSIIQEAVRALVIEGVIKNVKDASKAVEVLEAKFDDRIFDVWAVEDVVSQAKSEGKRISKSKARDILSTIEDRFDASIGINWDVISASL